MAGKKMKKAAKAMDACCSDSKMGMGKLSGWILVLLGIFGFLTAFGYLSINIIYFTYIISILTLVIGLFIVMKPAGSCC